MRRKNESAIYSPCSISRKFQRFSFSEDRLGIFGFDVVTFRRMDYVFRFRHVLLFHGEMRRVCLSVGRYKVPVETRLDEFTCFMTNERRELLSPEATRNLKY